EGAACARPGGIGKEAGQRAIKPGNWLLRESDRQAQARFATLSGGTVLQAEAAAMSFGDLPAEDQADAGTGGLGGEERHEQIGGIGNAGPFVLNPHFEVTVAATPPDADASAGFERCVHRVVNQVDEKLLELVRVRLNPNFRADSKLDRQARLEPDDAPDQRADFH